LSRQEDADTRADKEAEGLFQQQHGSDVQQIPMYGDKAPA
jgi:hypothetical protein